MIPEVTPECIRGTLLIADSKSGLEASPALMPSRSIPVNTPKEAPDPAGAWPNIVSPAAASSAPIPKGSLFL